MFPDESEVSSTSFDSRAGMTRWPVFQRLAALSSRLRGDRERTSAEITTQPAAGRGQALREAHRTLRKHMSSHPAIRQVMPHLAMVEKSLGRHGSRALFRLPLPMLRRSLEQLALLQRDDESQQDALNLRVLRLRLMEAISVRGHRPRPVARDSSLPVDSLGLGSLHEGGVEVRDASHDEFEEAVRSHPMRHLQAAPPQQH